MKSLIFTPLSQISAADLITEIYISDFSTLEEAQNALIENENADFENEEAESDWAFFLEMLDFLNENFHELKGGAAPLERDFFEEFKNDMDLAA
jgi:hypothetical protein